MKTYEIFCSEIRRFSVLVEAENEEDAMYLVYNDINKYKVVSEDITDWEISDVIEQETSNCKNERLQDELAELENELQMEVDLQKENAEQETTDGM